MTKECREALVAACVEMSRNTPASQNDESEYTWGFFLGTAQGARTMVKVLADHGELDFDAFVQEGRSRALGE